MIQQKRNNIYKTRELALAILNEFDNSLKPLDKIIENYSYNLFYLLKRDRSLVNYIIYGVIRWRIKLDWIIKKTAKRSLDSISQTILNIIRIGLFQIFFMNRIPSSAAVNTSVELTKTTKLTKKAAGFVNAILRNAIRNIGILDELDKANKLSLDHLSIIQSFPKWILSRWIKRFGYSETCKICEISNMIPEIFIRANSLKIDQNRLIEVIKNDVKKIKNISYLPHALSISGIIKPINEFKAFSNGMFSVQDSAAQIATHLLKPLPGEIILDACSGLGGKATHMAQLMNNQGKILAVDIVKSKLKKLRIDTQRLGINIIETKVIDLEIEPGIKNMLFDRIMLDAPCSGLGVIRRNPDTKWLSSNKRITECSKTQLRLLKKTSLLLKPKGIMAYVVCSTESEENENVINSFMKQNKCFKLKKIKKNQQFYEYLEEDGFFRTLSHIHYGMDSFFIALLKREY